MSKRTAGDHARRHAGTASSGSRRDVHSDSTPTRPDLPETPSKLAPSRDLAPPRGSPSLLTIVRRSLESECRLPPGATVLVAVSGGPDSMALLSCLARLGPKMGVALRAHGVDHGLRPEAAAELDLAERFAGKLGVPFGRTRVDVTRGSNLQARAREARWTALRAAAKPHSAVVATAHHAEDRAETVLMRVLRGAGARGLAVLGPIGPDLVRPLVRAQRSDVMAHLSRHHVPFATDPSNADPRYLRTRVRTEVMPLLRALDPAIVSHLSAIADDLEGAATARQSSATPTWTAGLPRATQTAIAELLRTRSKEARVWLPDGLVVMAAPQERRKESTD